jgi:exodeoxyribonuclease VII large subunit
MLMMMEIRKKSHAVDLMEQAIKNLNPLAPLQRGYALVLRDGKAVRNAETVEVGECLKVLLQNGNLDVEVI